MTYENQDLDLLLQLLSNRLINTDSHFVYKATQKDHSNSLHLCPKVSYKI